MLVGSKYQGSDESRVRVLPSIDYQWSNGFFAGALNGVGYNASTQSDRAYGVRVTADLAARSVAAMPSKDSVTLTLAPSWARSSTSARRAASR